MIEKILEIAFSGFWQFVGMAFNGWAFPKEIVMVQFAVPTANGIVLR